MKKYNRVYVEITNICNRSCSFCPGTERPLTRLSTSDFATILDKLEGVTEYIYLHVMGEPLTHPDLKRMIEIGKEKGFKIAITTNGTLLSKRENELLAALPYKINISLHSFEEGTREEHVDYIKDVISFIDKASAAGILTILRLWNRGYDEERNVNAEEMLKAYFTEEWVWGASGARIRPKLHLEYGDRFDWPDTEANDLGERVFCHGLGDHFGILSDGRVIPCCLDREGVITLGNVLDEDIETILSSDRALAIVEGFKNKTAVEDLCRRCGYARRFKL